MMIMSLVFSGYVAYAQSSLVFGGFVTNSFYCACSNNFLLTLSAPTNAQLLWFPGTPQYREFSLPRSGVWTLGMYSPGGVCLIPAFDGCAPFGAPIGTIGPIAGTSF